MRIGYNLSTNTIYNRPYDFQRSIRGITEMLENANHILRHFAQAEKVVNGFYEGQVDEEKLKAKLIMTDNGWRGLIDRAECHGYFRGQIGFLLDFCGAFEASNDTDPSLWETDKHSTLKANFERYLTLAEKTFSATGLVDLGEYRWQRALLNLGNYLLPRGRNLSLLVNTVTDETSWKRLLRGTGTKGPEPREFLKHLWDKLDSKEDLAPQLEGIIAGGKGLEPWQEAMVHCPEAFSYCEKNYIRKDYSGTVYLLRTTQLNGFHAELFTYCLCIQLKDVFTILQPFYQDVTDTYSEPHIQLSCNLQGMKATFNIFEKDGCYQVQIEKDDCLKITKLLDILQRTGYSESENSLQNRLSYSDIKGHLKAMDETLKSEFSSMVADI